MTKKDKSSSSGSTQPKRRVVKQAEAAAPADSAGHAADTKPKGVLRLTLSFITFPFRWIGRQLAKLNRFKFFRVVGRIVWPSYFRQSWGELRQVTWPTRRESIQLTLAVIIFSTVFGALIAGVDFVLDKVFKQLLLK